MTRKVPDVVLERYRLKELPETSARAVEAMLAADPELQARLDALEISDDEIRRQYRAQIVIHDKPAPSRRAVFGLAAAAVVTIVLIFALPRTPAPTSELPAERAKGTIGAAPSLSIYRRTAAGSERLADGERVHAGDLLRVGYASGGRPFGVILSIDGRGTVTMHLPPKGDRAVALERGKNVLLDAAYELDDAPRMERFYFVTGEDAFAVGPVMQAAKRAAAGEGGTVPSALALPPGLDQVTFAIQKEERE